MKVCKVMCESAKVIKCLEKGLKCMKGQIPPSTISRLKENLKRHEGLRRPEINEVFTDQEMGI